MEQAASQPGREAVPPAPQRSRLQRFGDALHRRDWVGVAIEVAVVVVGILIAFQIEQWGREREEAREEQRYLERMWRDTASIAEENREAAISHTRRGAELLRVLRAHADPAQGRRLTASFYRDCTFFIFPPLGHSDLAAREAIASGRLSMIQSQPVRSALERLMASLAEDADLTAYYRWRAERYPEHIDPFHEVKAESNGALTCVIDWPTALDTRTGMQATARTMRIHQTSARRRHDTWLQAVEARRLLACRLGKPECRQ